jgi:hypothetical protein
MDKFIKAKEILETNLKIGNTWQCPSVEEAYNLISEGCRELKAARLTQTNSEVIDQNLTLKNMTENNNNTTTTPKMNNNTSTKTDDHYILETMEQFGGSFVSYLAMAARHADAVNYWKLRNTFSEYWDEFAQIRAEMNMKRGLRE